MSLKSQAPLAVAAMPCSICQESVNPIQGAKLLCGVGNMHVFHHECIRPWFDLHASCPVCRSTFTSKAIRGLQRHPHRACASETAQHSLIDDIQRNIHRLVEQRNGSEKRCDKKKANRVITELQVRADELSRCM